MGPTERVCRRREPGGVSQRQAGVEKDPNFLREAVKLLAEAVMELEVSINTGAERYERAPERLAETASAVKGIAVPNR